MLKQFISITIMMLVSSMMTVATEKTLPQGVFKFDIYYNQYNIEKLGANPSGDKITWETVNLEDGVMNDIYLFRYLNYRALDGINLDLNTKLAKSWSKHMTHFDFAYGLTDKLTFFTNMSYEKAVLDYTDEYLAQAEHIDGAQSAAYKKPPDKATADHLNDTFVGFKYQLEHASVAFKMSDGFLLTGNDSEEKKYEDGIQELETSRGYSQYHYYLFKNISVYNQPIELTFGYIVLGKMTQIFLDNSKINFDPGNMNLLKLNVPIKLHDLVTLNSSYVLLYHRFDKYKGGNSEFSSANNNTKASYENWTKVPKSSGHVQMAKFELVYQPTIFLRLFMNTNLLLSNDKSGQLYDFPGRIEPGNMVAFGITLFAK